MSGIRAWRFAFTCGCCAVLCATALAQVSPTSEQVFLQARAAAANLPPLLAARESGMIAQDEIIAVPSQGLQDFKELFQTVSKWQTGGDSAVEVARTSVQTLEEGNAIEAYAAAAHFKQALQWLRGFRAPAPASQTSGMVYSRVIVQMLAHRDFAAVRSAFQQSASAGTDFPFEGAATALAATQVPELQRMSIAQQGLSASTDADDLHPAAIFFGAVANTFPEMDAQVESAILSFLTAAKADSAAHTERAVVDARGGSMLLAVLQQFDPERTEAAKSEFPAAAGASFGGGMVYQASPTGLVVGATIGPSTATRLFHSASTNPDQAMATAAGLKDKDARFAALAGIAKQLAKSRPLTAAKAAARALDLLDQDVAAAETGFAANLADAFHDMGDFAKAQQVAAIALEAADTHAQQAEQQFDLSTPDSVAKVTQGLLLPAVALSYPYENLASRFSSLTLEHARNCACPVAQPLILAKIAEGMTPAGAKVAY